MKTTTLLLLVVVLLTACQPAVAPQPTAGSTTESPAPTPTSATVEAPVGSVNDLVGVWWFPQAPGLVVEFKPDSTYRMWLSVEPSGIEAEGNFTLDAGQLTWVTSHPKCNDQPATYAAYLTRREGKAVQLRLKLVGSDPCADRAQAFQAGIAKPQGR